MNVLPSTPHSQRGVTMVLFTIGMVAIIGMAGLALDMGHAYLNKTRLQNALDAAALSGAKVLNDMHDVGQATAAALTTFNMHLEGELADAGLVPTVEVSETLSPFAPGGINPRYLRARVNDFPMQVWLAQVLPGIGNTQSVGGSAVAGPIPLGPKKCDIAPMIICADPGDTDCSDGNCFGYSMGGEEEQTLKTHSGNSSDWEVGPGNFQLIELDCGPGGDCVRDALSGEYEGCIEGDSVTTKPGNTVGPVAQGFNTRFGIYQGGMSSSEAPPDVVTYRDFDSSGNYFWHEGYLSRLQNGPWDYSPQPEGMGVPQRRILAVPFGNCTGTTDGRGEVEVLGYGCFFMTRPTSHSGNTQEIYGQFIAECKADGSVIEAPPIDDDDFDLYKIVLYKDPDSQDS
ncbi:conserved hypothetical protein [Nitrosococcus halophilus Nc 4]|uniref:Putative Flp pilus-assembly TadG-like N-terminal domain-containing protein n=1 Tax=Nitrosococcus halophilus (strain Nc4) TaxID=472759 RepID=D5C116_NITHN|nr:Tad domain-containing protein [Nitrosococcus halophilus]ADE14573.1 conserved hypothetical protein [Nitrosococcus halophilus Nc 4]